MVKLCKYHDELMVDYPYVVKLKDAEKLLHAKTNAELIPEVQEWCERECPNQYEWDTLFRHSKARKDMVLVFFFSTVEQAVEFKLRFG